MITRRSVLRVVQITAILTVCSFFSLAQKSELPDSFLVKGDVLSLEFSQKSGDLIHIVDMSTNTDFIDAKEGLTRLWQIDMLPGVQPAVITPAMASKFSVERLNAEGTTLKMVWEGFNLPFSKTLRVEVVVAVDPKKPMSNWSIAIEKPGELHVEKVRFPQIPSLARQSDERLAVPLWMGQLTAAPRALICGPENPLKRLEWPYPGAMSMQCLAFYRQNGPGLYLSCDDTAAYRKAFAFWGDSSGRVNYEVIHYPENESSAQTSFAPQYNVVIGSFSGDWITAAERYRSWAIHQPWAVGSRLNRGLVADWLLKTSLWVWNRGKSDVVLEPAVDLQHQLHLPVSVFWHWWHGCSYDAGFPEYLPPREGTEHFKSALASAQGEGIHAIVYMNQRLWGMTTKSWLDKGAERYAVKGLDGQVRPEIYNTYTQQPCATMCMATSFWRNTYAGIAEEALKDLHVDGIYMDQACSSLLCYDPTHGHSLGGGKFWINGFRLLSTDIRERTKLTKNTLLAGEGVGEAWLPYLDLMLTLQVSKERYARPNDGWDVIPFFQSVYHAYGVTYGNYSSLIVPPYDELWPAEFAPKDPLKLLDRKYATQFYIEQARTVLWGNQPTIANYRPFQRNERKEEIAYLLKLSKVREQALKYLLYGTFLRSPDFNVTDIKFPISRLSIYAGRKGKPAETTKKKPSSDDGVDDSGKDKGESSFESHSSPVVSGTWLAKDGDIAIALANAGPDHLPLHFDVKQYGIRSGAKVALISEPGKKDFGTVGADGTLTIDVPSHEVYVLELSEQ